MTKLDQTCKEWKRSVTGLFSSLVFCLIYAGGEYNLFLPMGSTRWRECSCVEFIAFVCFFLCMSLFACLLHLFVWCMSLFACLLHSFAWCLSLFACLLQRSKINALTHGFLDDLDCEVYKLFFCDTGKHSWKFTNVIKKLALTICYTLLLYSFNRHNLFITRKTIL